MVPLARALLGHGIEPRFVFSKQDPGLDDRALAIEEFTRLDLGCPKGSCAHAQVKEVTRALLPLLSGQPDLLIVSGDSAGALGAALAAFVAGVPVGHLEAGHREPGRPASPVEEYGEAIDMDAELLIAKDEAAADTLRLQGVGGEIHVSSEEGVVPAAEPASERVAIIVANWLQQRPLTRSLA